MNHSRLHSVCAEVVILQTEDQVPAGQCPVSSQSRPSFHFPSHALDCSTASLGDLSACQSLSAALALPQSNTRSPIQSPYRR